MLTQGAGWKAANLKDIPPIKDTYMKGWHSIRHRLGITSFGVNAISVNAGEELVKEHNEEGESPQQEFFYITEGSADFKLDGKLLKATTGTCLSIEPAVRRSAIATSSPTTVLIVGAPIGKAYQIPSWEIQ